MYSMRICPSYIVFAVNELTEYRTYSFIRELGASAWSTTRLCCLERPADIILPLKRSTKSDLCNRNEYAGWHKVFMCVGISKSPSCCGGVMFLTYNTRICGATTAF